MDFLQGPVDYELCRLWIQPAVFHVKRRRGNYPHFFPRILLASAKGTRLANTKLQILHKRTMGVGVEKFLAQTKIILFYACLRVVVPSWTHECSSHPTDARSCR